MVIDFATSSITSARRNADLNNAKNASFMTADTAALLNRITFLTDQTAVVIDPPEKGCDEAFLKQLLAFGPKRVFYVGCNVHTQARDMGLMVERARGVRYEIESCKGLTFSHRRGMSRVLLFCRGVRRDRGKLREQHR